jgi:hypothetical protein
MGRLWTPTLGIVALALGVAVAVLSTRTAGVKSELEDVKSRLEKLEQGQREGRSVSQAAIEEVRQELSKIEKSGSSRALPGSAAPAGASGLPTLATEEELRKLVDERIDEKVDAKLQSQLARKSEAGAAAGGDRKMPLHDMAKELTLDPESQAKVAEIANTAKKEIFEIIRTPRPDGTNFADQLIDVMLKGDQPGAQKLFQQLFTEKIPGTATPYVVAVANVQEKANQGLRATMGDPSFQRYLNMNVHPENIETGFDPWAEYLKVRAGR